MIVEVVYSTKDYEKARKYNVKMAYKKGKVDKVFEYCEDDLSSQFKKKNKQILSCRRGAGYWVWKPYVVDMTLEKIHMGDYLFYCDGGAFVTKDIKQLSHFMEMENTDLLVFDIVSAIERKWTKRDVFIALSCDDNRYTETNQRCATYFMIKKTEKTIALIKEWLTYAENYNLISDVDNLIYHQKNYEGFCENRHDQSLFSLLTKKSGYKSYPDISQFRYSFGICERLKESREKNPLPIMVCLHRQRKADFTSIARETILCYFPKLKRVLHYGYH